MDRVEEWKGLVCWAKWVCDRKVAAGRHPLEGGLGGRGVLCRGEGWVPPAGWGWKGVLLFEW